MLSEGIVQMESTKLTKSKKVPKQKQNSSGPAKSASSIMCSSMRCSGFSTVNDFACI